MLDKIPSMGGFGWDDMHIFKAALVHKFSDFVTGRLGYNFGQSPISNERVFANVIAPAIVEHHIAAGISFTPKVQHEVTLTGYYVPMSSQTDSGAGDLFSQIGRGTKIGMRQWGAQLGYKYKFGKK